ncbi:IclR family transcriptional regulator [Saccharopolyspora shandongensis]|uniref:IclR family transcriptional regulator n=1 Tax=Saccharopolyspora shandongensis TaxID=418495 RepID=UPI0034180541
MTSTLRMNAESAVEEPVPPSMVERMTLILDLFEHPHTRRNLEEVTRRTRLPRSTAHRILDQLVRLRWLDHTTSGYRLGKRALGLGGREIGQNALRSAAAPVLHDLAIRTKLVVHLAVLSGTEVYYLDKVGGRSAVDVPSRVGGRAPAHCTALGKAMLAWLPPERIDTEYAEAVRRTPRSIGDLGILHQELDRIRRRRGLAFERGECFAHVSCVGIALRGQEGPAAAISLVGDVHTPMERVAPLLMQAAHAVSNEFFAGPVLSRPDLSAPQQTWSSEAMTRFLTVGDGGDWL